MNKFTPGPWKVDLGFIDKSWLKGKCQVVVFAGEEPVAICSDNDPNAKLIAAAPDMIELLERTKARLEQWDKDNICTDDDLYTDLLWTIRQAKGEKNELPLH